MREIKFRAWDKDGMTYSFCVHACGWVAYMNQDWLSEECTPILMQYTGLLDKNGKEIYEGDIVKYKSYCNLDYKDDYSIGKVMWGETGDSDGYSHSRHFEWVVSGDSLADIADGDYDGFECEIIGNIYENPDLLQ